LHKGGRCSSLALFGANLLKLRPRIVVKEGKMGADKKYRGNMEKVIAKYCEETLNEFDTPDLDKVFVTYTTATPEMVAAAKQALTDRGFKNIYETHAGCTIASHCGGNTLGILYFNDGNN
jgi:fatty acid-binding protein DegV